MDDTRWQAEHARTQARGEALVPAAHRRAAAASFAACFGIYVAGLAPSIYWLDSSEFAVASFELGVAHPPGHPLALLCGKAAALLPVGDVAFRVGLASALLTAIAAALVALLGAELARRTLASLPRRGAPVAEGGPDRGDGWIEGLAGAGAGIGFGVSYAAAFQAVRPEVYGLHTALTLAAILCLAGSQRLAGSDGRRAIYLAALLLGLALANHHYLALLAAAGAGPWLIARAVEERRAGASLGRMTAASLSFASLGLLLYAYLPARASRHPEVDWGAPGGARSFLWTVSAELFRRQVHRTLPQPASDVIWALGGELGLAALAALLGVYLVLRPPAMRSLGALVIGVAIADAAATAVFFDSQNPDIYGYLEIAVALGAVVAATAPALLAGLVARTPGAPRRAVARGLAAIVAAGFVASAGSELPRSFRTRFRDTARYGGALLDETPPRAGLLTSDFQTVFALWYLRGVEGQRPDLDHLHPHFLANPGYRDEALLRTPSLAPLIVPTGPLGPAALVAAARPALVLEYDLDAPTDLIPHLVPLGGLLAISPVPPDDATRSRAEEDAERRWTGLLGRLDSSEPQTRRAIYYREFLLGHYACAAGRGAYAARALDRALSLRGGANDDPDLSALSRRCLGR